MKKTDKKEKIVTSKADNKIEVKAENEDKVSVVKEQKEEKKKQDNKKAKFIQRFLAYFIDIILVTTVATMVASPFLNEKSAEKLNKEQTELVDKYSKAEVSFGTYYIETMSISFQNSKLNGITSLIVIFLEIMYFIVFQFYNGGKTVGKALLKIKIVSEDDSDLTMNQILVRNLLIDSILLDMIIMAFTIFASQSVYIYGVTCFEVIQYIVLLASAFMIIYGKTGRGIHDVITHTKVVSIN